MSLHRFSIPPLPAALLVLIFALGAINAFWGLGAGQVNDPFHYGEFVASLESLMSASRETPLPLTIHGASDVIPGLLASMWVGSTHHFFPTLLIIASINTLTAALLVLVISRLSPEPSNARTGLLLSTALIAPLCVGFRDLFLISVLFLHVLLRDHMACASPSKRTYALAIARGVIAAIGMHWSFDRGIATAMILVTYCATHLLLTRRTTATGIATLLSVALTLAGLWYVHPLFSPKNYADNVLFLVSTSAQWRYPWRAFLVLKVELMTAIGTSAALGILVFARGNRSAASASQHAELIGLLTLNIMLLRIGINRADLQHILMGSWGIPPLLAWTMARPAWTLTDRRVKVGAFAALLVCCAILTFEYRQYELVPVMLLIAASTILIHSRLGQPILSPAWKTVTLAASALLLLGLTGQSMHRGAFLWVERWQPTMSNAALSPPGVRWAAEALMQAKVQCVFDFSNEGLIQGLVRKPNCTRITYPVYGNTSHEDEMIEALELAKPSALVSSSGSWFYKIDGKPMHERFPRLATYIRDRYPDEQCGTDAHCVRFRR